MLFILFLVTIFVLGVTAWIIYFGLQSKALSKETKNNRYTRNIFTKKILMVGDSVMRGVGTSSQEYSLCSLVASYSSHSSVTVFAKDGVRCREILEAIKKEKYESHDQVIIFCGGMDIIYFSREDKVKKDLQNLFLYLKSIAPHVVYVSPPNIGNAPIFPFPVSFIYKYRSQKFISIAQDCAYQCGVSIVDYSSIKNIHFARDKSHPSDIGYRKLFELFKEHIVQ